MSLKIAIVLWVRLKNKGDFKLRHLIIIVTTILFYPSVLFAQKTLIHAGSMIDGVAKKIKTKQTIVIEDGVIIDVKSGYTKAKPNDIVIDLKNTTVTPGWMDLHVHLGSQSSPQSYSEDFYLNPEDFAYRSVPWIEKTLLAGFTTVRDVGGEVVLAARNAVNNGYINGPRIFSAGRSIGTTGGHADPSSGLNRKFEGILDRMMLLLTGLMMQ